MPIILCFSFSSLIRQSFFFSRFISSGSFYLSFASLSFADLLSRCFVSCGTILLFTGFLLRKHLYFFTLFPSREAPLYVAFTSAFSPCTLIFNGAPFLFLLTSLCLA